jgi:hypothetical protein
LAEKLVPFLDFLVQLVLVEDQGIESLAVGGFRQVELSAADRPPIQGEEQPTAEDRR